MCGWIALAVRSSQRILGDGLRERYVDWERTASMEASTIPEVCEGDQIWSSIMAVCQVAVLRMLFFSGVGGEVEVEVEVDGQMNGLKATRDERRAPNRSMLSIPVIVDQPEISRAEEMRNCVMLMAP